MGSTADRLGSSPGLLRLRWGSCAFSSYSAVSMRSGWLQWGSFYLAITIDKGETMEGHNDYLPTIWQTWDWCFLKASEWDRCHRASMPAGSELVVEEHGVWNFFKGSNQHTISVKGQRVSTLGFKDQETKSKVLWKMSYSRESKFPQIFVLVQFVMWRSKVFDGPDALWGRFGMHTPTTGSLLMLHSVLICQKRDRISALKMPLCLQRLTGPKPVHQHFSRNVFIAGRHFWRSGRLCAFC